MKNLFYPFLFMALFIFVSCSDDDVIEDINPDETIVIEDSKPSAKIESLGFYVLNEDWFGHDNGSLNYFKNDGSIIYRAYRAANQGKTLGVTSQFATIYGDNIYFVSKQENRLIVADAKTLNEKAVLTEIKGDGRSFLGINQEKGYLGTSKGVQVFDIEKFQLGNSIEGIEGQVGNMNLIDKRAFILVQSKGVYIVNTLNNEIESLISGNFNCMTQGKDGNIWIGADTKLIKLDSYSLDVSEVNIADAPISGSWGAWNAGSLCASTQTNTLYWSTGGGMFGGGKTIAKYDIDTQELQSKFYELGKDETGIQLVLYGAGIRVNPLNDKLVLTVKRKGYGDAGSYNWLYIISNIGSLEKSITVNGDNGSGGTWGTGEGRYFWFPAMPFFEDVNAPEILLNQVILKPNERKAISLNDKIVDADNASTSILKTISYEKSDLKYEIIRDSLIITSTQNTGKMKLTIQANSNGKLVEKEIRIDIRN